MNKTGMLQTKQKNLVEVCPQCCKLINSSANRLVHDTCGHLKCRICLLQEITGCLLCVAKSKSLESVENKIDSIQKEECESSTATKCPEHQQRKSVITSLALQIAEQKQSSESNPVPHLQTVDTDTCHLIKQTLEKDILFPTDIVKRSTGNFYHLKRVFSQRFFNENKNKKNKACETEEKWAVTTNDTKSDSNENKIVEKKTWKVPSHIQVQYYCKIHNVAVQGKNNFLKHHLTCGSDSGTETSPHVCEICNRSYKAIGKLNRHMKIHTKTSKFKCDKCHKLCPDNYALKEHERTHTQQKPYECRYCSKKFSGLPNFKRHEKIHKNEKKFVCNDCGFRFLTKTELVRHGVTHTNIKAFACTFCSSKFAFKRTLVRHLKTHDKNLLRIKCSQCDSTFKRKDNLERHVRTAHFEVKTEKCESTADPGD